MRRVVFSFTPTRTSFRDPIPTNELPTRSDSLEAVERWHIERVLEEKLPSVGDVAEVLGISAKTLYEKRKRYGLIDQRYENPVTVSKEALIRATAEAGSIAGGARALGITPQHAYYLRSKYNITESTKTD